MSTPLSVAHLNWHWKTVKVETVFFSRVSFLDFSLTNYPESETGCLGCQTEWSRINM